MRGFGGVKSVWRCGDLRKVTWPSGTFMTKIMRWPASYRRAAWGKVKAFSRRAGHSDQLGSVGDSRIKGRQDRGVQECDGI